MLKPANALLEGDPRFREMARLDPSMGHSRPMRMDDLRSLVEPIALGLSVPADIRDQFDIARNVFVYSWFVYDFAALAEKQGFAALEMALRRRTRPEEALNTSRSPGLGKLLEKAKKNGWLRAGDFEIPSINGSDTPMSRIDLLLDFRNHAMHGNIHLLPQETPTVLGLCADVINALFTLSADASKPTKRADPR